MTDSSVSGYGASATRGVLWLGTSSGTNNLLQFLQLVVLARILEPNELGIVAILAILLSLIDMMTDLGMANALIQKVTLSRNDVSSAYWFNVLLAIVFAATFLVIAGPVSNAYDQPALMLPFALASIVFLVMSHGQIFKGLLERNQEFKPVAIAEASSGGLNFVVTILAALSGLGPLSYVLGRISAAVVKTTLYRVYGARIQKKIGFSFSPRAAWGLIRFGGIQTLDAMVSYVHNTAGALIVGMSASVIQLGGFNLAYNLTVNLPGTINTVFNRSTFPTFARLQADRQRILAAYVKVLGITGLVNFPILVGMGLVAHELVGVVFGEKWLWIVPIVQALAFSGCARAITNPIGTLFMGIGKPTVPLLINILRTAVVVVGSLVVAPTWGAIGIAWVLAASAVLTLVANYVVLYGFFRLPGSTFTRTILKPALLVMPMFVGVLLMQLIFTRFAEPAAVALVVNVTLGVIIFVGTLMLTRDETSRELLSRLRPGHRR